MHKGNIMPKVNDEYLQDKREQILDAATRVCMRKPVYSIAMRDIITETGWSQGAIYRYFKNVHLILFELMNRQTAGLRNRPYSYTARGAGTHHSQNFGSRYTVNIDERSFVW